MLENIGGYGVDKAKFWIELDVHEANTRLEEWQRVFGLDSGPQGGKVYNVQTVKRGEREASYYYAFDVWGDSAARIDELDFEKWFPYLDRLDLKTTMPMTVEGQKNYLDYLEQKVADKRNFGWLNSKVRQKRENRDAGGHGVYLGSHKSDFRVQWTMRGDEDGYQEFQLQDTRLAHAINYQKVVAVPDGSGSPNYGWDVLCRSVLTGAQIELNDLDGLYDSDRAAILAGREDVHHIMEDKLDYIERYIDRLPKDALFGLYRALELKLFGEPSELAIGEGLGNRGLISPQDEE